MSIPDSTRLMWGGITQKILMARQWRICCEVHVCNSWQVWCRSLPCKVLSSTISEPSVENLRMYTILSLEEYANSFRAEQNARSVMIPSLASSACSEPSAPDAARKISCRPPTSRSQIQIRRSQPALTWKYHIFRDYPAEKGCKTIIPNH